MQFPLKGEVLRIAIIVLFAVASYNWALHCEQFSKNSVSPYNLVEQIGCDYANPI